MRLKLFTPGHGPFMDSLIMYGLVSALPPDVKCYVSGTAGSFEIEIEGRDVNDVAKSIASDIELRKESVMEQLLGQLKLIQKGSQKRFESYLNSYANPDVVAKNLEEAYMFPGHAQREGRGQRGQHVWLPLYPHVGKYFTEEYRYVASNYGVCPLCITLAALGFYKAAIPIRYMPPKNASRIILLSFEGGASGELLANMLTYVRGEEFVRAITRLRSALDQLPLSTFTYVVLAQLSGDVIRYLYGSEAVWVALSTVFDVVKGQVVQIRGYENVYIDRYISSLVHLMRVDERLDEEHRLHPLHKLRTITVDLVNRGEAAAIEALYRFLNTRSSLDLYVAVRQVVKALKGGFGKGFCEELACLTQLA
ncbi:MAG: hypothetical protein QXK12_08085 [Candidatus Nezhaarchaeales archaeon]